MKKCEKCNVEMLEGYLYGKPRYIDIDHDINKFYFNVKTGEKENVFGIPIDKTKRYRLNSYVCPKCGKVESYVDLNTTEND